MRLRAATVALCSGLLLALASWVVSTSEARAGGGQPHLYDLRGFAETHPALVSGLHALHGGHTDDGEARSKGIEGIVRLIASGEVDRDPLAKDTARWLLAELQLASGRADLARPQLEALVKEGRGLCDEARARLAALLEAEGDILGAARMLLSTTPGSKGQLDAVRRAVQLLEGLGDHEAIEDGLRRVLAHPLPGGARTGLVSRLTEARLALGDREGAAGPLRARWWASGSARALDSLVALGEGPLPEEVLARLVFKTGRRDAGDLARDLKKRAAKKTWGKRYLRWARYVLDRHDEDARDKALDRLERLDRRFAGRAFEPYHLYAKALVLRRMDRDVEAAGLYQQIADRWPQHMLAAESLNEAAGLLAISGLYADADVLYRRALNLAPRGAVQREALWRVGFGAVLAGSWADAERYLGRLDTLYGGERDGIGIAWAEKAGYWLARTAELQGDAERAAGLYAEVALRFPTGWYAMLAKQRREALLRQLEAPAVAAVALGTYASSGGGVRYLDPWRDLRVVAHPELDGPVAMLRLGDLGAARDGLMALYEADRLPGSARVLLSRLLVASGDETMAHRVLKRPSVLPYMPSAADLEILADRYPLAYRETIDAVARDADMPPALLAGLVHIESRFSEDARSPAGALGLCQLLLGTARTIATRALGMGKLSRKRLFEPRTNLKIGGKLLGELLSHFQGHPALALAAYNAGRGAVRKWLRQRGHLEVDAFVETIPYDQARRYVARVLSMSAVYSRLYGLEAGAAEVPLKLPLALGPFLEDAPEERGG